MKKLGSWVGKLFLFFTAILLVLVIGEWVYRNQWVDFYAPEIQALNEQQKEELPTILFFGDSFTAQQSGYVSMLRGEFPQYRLINSAVPGTGIFETAYMAPKRIEKFQPDVVVFQLYVGNDLLDIRHPLNHTHLGIVRNLYWGLCDRLHILRWINYKSGQLKALLGDKGSEQQPKEIGQFSVETYSPRIKRYIRAEPGYISNSVHLAGKRDTDMKILINELHQLITKLDPAVRVFILVVPHCTQVAPFYYEAYEAMGASLPAAVTHFRLHYPFIERLENTVGTLRQVTILNPLEHLQLLDIEGGRLYYENDPHMTELGNILLSIEVSDALREMEIQHTEKATF